MKLTPRSIARGRAASEVLSSVLPQASPPIPQAPKPISEIFQPVRPNVRYCMCEVISFYSCSSGCIKFMLVSIVYSDFQEDRKDCQMMFNLRSKHPVGTRG